MLLFYIISYFVIGLIIRSVGPLAKELNHRFIHDSWNKYFKKGFYKFYSEEIKLRQFIWGELLISTIFLLFWPLFTFLFIPSYYYKTKTKREFLQRIENSEGKFLYLESSESIDTIGGGIIICNDCNYQEEIVVSKQGRDLNIGSVSTLGFQCQKCGKIQAIINLLNINARSQCECGGTLSRTRKVFCPTCKSYNIKYKGQLVLKNIEGTWYHKN